MFCTFFNNKKICGASLINFICIFLFMTTNIHDIDLIKFVVTGVF